MKGFCEFFASKNRKEFIGNKAAVGEIGVELFQDVMANLLYVFFLPLPHHLPSSFSYRFPSLTTKGLLKKKSLTSQRSPPGQLLLISRSCMPMLIWGLSMGMLW